MQILTCSPLWRQCRRHGVDCVISASNSMFSLHPWTTISVFVFLGSNNSFKLSLTFCCYSDFLSKHQLSLVSKILSLLSASFWIHWPGNHISFVIYLKACTSCITVQLGRFPPSHRPDHTCLTSGKRARSWALNQDGYVDRVPWHGRWVTLCCPFLG